MKLMRKLTVLTAAVFLAAVSILSSSNYAAASGSYYFGFDDGNGLAAFVPVANGVVRMPGVSLERVTGENGCPALRGDGYANLKMVPAAEPVPPGPPTYLGTWMEAIVPAEGANQIALDFAARSTDSTEGAILLVYIGSEAPKDARQFVALKDTLAGTWQHFHFETMAATSKNLHFAIGWAGDYGSMGIDCISVNVQSVTMPPSSGVTGATGAGK